MNDLIKSEAIKATFSGLTPYESDRLRQCPYCKRFHLVHNRSRDYCSDWCADTDYNQQRRLKKQAVQIKAAGGLIPVIEPPKDQHLLNTAIQPSFEEQFNLNLGILNCLNIQPEMGTHFNLDLLLKEGYDISVYTARYKLNNIPSGLECYYLVCGDFMLFRIDEDIILVKKFSN